MLTREDIQIAKGACDTLRANLDALEAVTLRYISEHGNDPHDDSQRFTQPLRGLIGTTKSHINSLLEFPAEDADHTVQVFNNITKKSAINIGLPYVLEKLPKIIDSFKPYLKSEDDKLLCETIKKSVTKLAEKVSELKKNPKSDTNNKEDVAQLKMR